jgi:hypothetical protein
MAQSISDPWFKAQALAWILRYSTEDILSIARMAETAATECDDDYKKTAVLAWEIAAFAERKMLAEARRVLRMALSQATSVMPLASRAEALTLLLHAAIKMGSKDESVVVDELISSCEKGSHWRCKRAIRDAGKLVNGEIQPRLFFW